MKERPSGTRYWIRLRKMLLTDNDRRRNQRKQDSLVGSR